MNQTKQLAIAAVAAAVGGVFCGQANAAQQIIGAGASAINSTLKNIIVNDYCGSGVAITIFDNGGSNGLTSTPIGKGTVYRVNCTPTSTVKFTSGLDISYDTTGGSWKGLLAAVSPTGEFEVLAQSSLNQYIPLTIDLTSAGGCTTTVGGLGTSGNISLAYGCSVVAIPAGATVNFGFTDVERAMFSNTPYNQPLISGTWSQGGTPAYLYTAANGLAFPSGWTEKSGYPVQAFGVVFGIAASSALYAALQADQITSGLLGSSCSGTIGAWAPGGNACTPSITKSQYRSIVATVGGALTLDASPLFANGSPSGSSAVLELARRDQGSGTQASSNAFFLNAGCGSNGNSYSGLGPMLPSDTSAYTGSGTDELTVTYNATTTAVINELNNPVNNTATSFAIGVVSAENDKSSALTGGAGFLRLDGVYPSNTNAAAGVYPYESTENFHCSASNASGTDGYTLCQDLANKNGANNVPVSDTLSGYTGVGIVQISNASTVFFTNKGNMCDGLVHN